MESTLVKILAELKSINGGINALCIALGGGVGMMFIGLMFNYGVMKGMADEKRRSNKSSD